MYVRPNGCQSGWRIDYQVRVSSQFRSKLQCLRNLGNDSIHIIEESNGWLSTNVRAHWRWLSGRWSLPHYLRADRLYIYDCALKDLQEVYNIAKNIHAVLRNHRHMMAEKLLNMFARSDWSTSGTLGGDAETEALANLTLDCEPSWSSYILMARPSKELQKALLQLINQYSEKKA